jgi:hypothetical protein
MAGEVGFELLYWVPFLRWFAERFDVPPERLIVCPEAARRLVSAVCVAVFRRILTR